VLSWASARDEEPRSHEGDERGRSRESEQGHRIGPPRRHGACAPLWGHVDPRESSIHGAGGKDVVARCEPAIELTLDIHVADHAEPPSSVAGRRSASMAARIAR
jgi:hypothetical protein